MTHVIGAIVAAMLAAQPDASPPPVDEKLLNAFDQVERDVRRLGDWSQQSAIIRDAVRKVWQRSGWTDETDAYALKVAEEVSAIPPWDFPARMDKFTGLLAERYQLNDEQKSRVTSLFYQESFGFFLKNAKVVIDQAREVVGARVRQEPFTPEQVARWARDGAPLMADGRARIERIADLMRQDLSPAQREILQRDFAGFERRFRDMEKMRTEWADGRWRPEDWGLEADPIQSGQAAPAPTDQPAKSGRTPGPRGLSGPTRLLPHDETTWVIYVRDFSQRYRLDSAQRTAADSILTELVERAAQFRRDHANEIARVPMPARTYDPALAPIRRVFEELKARLDPIPTGAQRLLSGP